MQKSMSAWLYQMNQEDWAAEKYRYEIRENQRWRWSYNRKQSPGLPDPGDTLVFFYAPRKAKDPGFYGWAIVERCDKEERLVYFTPVAPSDRLKMNPWWDDDAKRIASEIRGKRPRATLFEIPGPIMPKIRRGISRWLNSDE